MKQHWPRIILALGLLFSSGLAQALYLSSDVFVLESDQDFLSRQFLNDSNSTNMYLTRMYQVDRPGKKEQASYISEGELMHSPLRLVVNGGQTEYFKIFYRGPADDKERYYRMVIQEVPLAAIKDEGEEKDGLVSAITALDTYVVVRPRLLNQTYDYDVAAGRLTNTGNTFLRVLMNQGCDSETEDEAVVYDLLPGQVLNHERLRGQHRKFIVTSSRYLKLGEQCFNS